MTGLAGSWSIAHCFTEGLLVTLGPMPPDQIRRGKGALRESMTKALKKKELDQFRNILNEEKRKILRHLEDISESAEEGLKMSGGDSADIASLEINQASLQKIGKREETLLRKIDLAIAKIEDRNSTQNQPQPNELVPRKRLMKKDARPQ